MKFSETKATIRRRPALLGEHSVEVLQDLGLSEANIEELKNAKVI